MDELSKISEALKDEIVERLSSARSSIDLWFGDFTLIQLSEDTAVFSTPTKLRKKILSTKYIGVIREALEEIIGFSVDIEIRALDDEQSTVTELSPVTRTAEAEASADSLGAQRISDMIDEKEKAERRPLLEEYTFDNFVEGSSNKFAKAACFAVANEPCVYNPLFIYGHSGLGKTHLLRAVMNHMKKNYPEMKIVYKTCENFTNELINAIGNHKTAEFKDNYRNADVLLIDDIQFLANKESTQEEFFHTFSALYESDKQIILTSDRPPMEIKPLTDRLRTRFEGGLLADVQPPSFELRTAIIRKKSDSMGLTVSNTLVDYMAERLNNNIRQIEGVLKKLYAISSLTGAEITKESIDHVISIVDPGNIPNDAMIERILNETSKKYGVSVDDIRSKKKTASIAVARHVAIYITRKLTALSLKEIGKAFDRNYTTVMDSVNIIETQLRTVNNFESELNKLIAKIKGV